MRSEVGLVIEWQPSEISEDDRTIETHEELMDYIVGTLVSNASFDHIEMDVVSSGVKDLEV
jgi:DNA mismatch repair protein MutH